MSHVHSRSGNSDVVKGALALVGEFGAATKPKHQKNKGQFLECRQPLKNRAGARR